MRFFIHANRLLATRRMLSCRSFDELRSLGVSCDGDKATGTEFFHYIEAKGLCRQFATTQLDIGAPWRLRGRSPLLAAHACKQAVA